MTRELHTSDVIDYNGLEDVVALSWFDARTCVVVRPRSSATTVNVAFRTLDELDAPYRDLSSWEDLCKEVEGSPLHGGFIEMGPQ